MQASFAGRPKGSPAVSETPPPARPPGRSPERPPERPIDRNQAEVDEARRHLARVEAESGAFTAGIGRLGTSLGDHFTGADGEDPVERRAMVIGRVLSLLATLGLLVWLLSAYL